MKKSISIAAATLLLVCVAFTGLSLAGAVKLDLYPSGDSSEPAQGFAVINRPAAASQNAVILQVQVRGLAPGTYTVKSAGQVLGTFTTNAKGNGHFHRNFAASDPEIVKGALASKTRVNIWSTSPPPVEQLLRTLKIPWLLGLVVSLGAEPLESAPSLSLRYLLQKR